MVRRVRRFAAWLGILAILFAQAAVAAYACPAAPAATAAEEAPRMPCGEMDPAAPNLCERHCHGQDQQPGPASLALPVFLATFAVAPAVDAAAPPPHHAQRAPQPAASPPLAYRHRFRL